MLLKRILLSLSVIFLMSFNLLYAVPVTIGDVEMGNDQKSQAFEQVKKKLGKWEGTMEQGLTGAVFNVSYEFELTSGGNTITWTDNGPYALPTTGTTVNIAFRYTGYDGSNWFIDDVSIEENTMSIDDEDTLDMRIYPNPVDGNFVTILSPVNGTKYIQVFDIMGKRVMDTTINNNTLDVSSINSGFYMIKVTINGQSKISKLVVR